MSVVNVIDMAIVFDPGVAAAWGVPVTAVGMGVEIAHKTWVANREFARSGSKAQHATSAGSSGSAFIFKFGKTSPTGRASAVTTLSKKF
jgi:hypothetical protein